MEKNLLDFLEFEICHNRVSPFGQNTAAVGIHVHSQMDDNEHIFRPRRQIRRFGTESEGEWLKTQKRLVEALLLTGDDVPAVPPAQHRAGAAVTPRIAPPQNKPTLPTLGHSDSSSHPAVDEVLSPWQPYDCAGAEESGCRDAVAAKTSCAPAARGWVSQHRA